MAVDNDSLSQPRNRPPERKVRSQLERMLVSAIFTRSERLSAFLRFVVEEKIAGQAAGLKEQVLGSRLYRKGGEFDGAADPIVRVDARRLRDKLREYYSEFPRDPIIISLPKGSYTPVFDENPTANVPTLLSFPAARNLGPDSQDRRARWIAGAVAGILASIIGWTVARKQPGAPVTIARITSFPGEIGAPALSPDGAFVAFRGKDRTRRGPWTFGSRRSRTKAYAA